MLKGGININRRVYKYRLWIKHRNQKNLIRRTIRKQQIRARRTAEHRYNASLKINNKYDPKSKKYIFEAPLTFSFTKAADETTYFFHHLMNFITDKRNFGKSIYIDISKITVLTIDALMYLLAIVNNLNTNFYNKYSFSGNSPQNEHVRKMFVESGFFKYVKRQGQMPLVQNKDNIQILSGEDSSTAVAKSMSDFVSNLCGVSVKKCSFLYVMMIELMSNTKKHAYDDTANILTPHWYCFAEYDKVDTISFTFMDTGAGIPSTVQRNFPEKIDILKLKGDDKYVISALDGDFRTATKQSHRGKGLPKIRSFCSAGKINNMRIITNKASVFVRKDGFSSTTVPSALQGTLYYWEIKLSDLKGEKI